MVSRVMTSYAVKIIQGSGFLQEFSAIRMTHLGHIYTSIGTLEKLFYQNSAVACRR